MLDTVLREAYAREARMKMHGGKEIRKRNKAT